MHGANFKNSGRVCRVMKPSLIELEKLRSQMKVIYANGFMENGCKPNPNPPLFTFA